MNFFKDDNYESTGSVDRFLVFWHAEAEDISFVGINLVEDGTQFTIPKRGCARRVAANDDKVICDSHTPY